MKDEFAFPFNELGHGGAILVDFEAHNTRGTFLPFKQFTDAFNDIKGLVVAEVIPTLNRAIKSHKRRQTAVWAISSQTLALPGYWCVTLGITASTSADIDEKIFRTIVSHACAEIHTVDGHFSEQTQEAHAEVPTSIGLVLIIDDEPIRIIPDSGFPFDVPRHAQPPIRRLPDETHEQFQHRLMIDGL